jgi:hypothetical protein
MSGAGTGLQNSVHPASSGLETRKVSQLSLNSRVMSSHGPGEAPGVGRRNE